MILRTPFFALLISFVVLALGTHGQTPQTPPEEPVIRISTELVQIDLLALDKDGSSVNDLKPEDLRLFQDGKEQEILYLTYVSPTESRRMVKSNVKQPKSEKAIGVPPTGTRSSQGRIITFILDDANCLSTLDGTLNMRDSVLRFIDDQMLPDDRVAIYRTGVGANLLQIYTSNKEVLRRAAKKTNLLPTRNCGSMFEPLRDQSSLRGSGVGEAPFEPEDSKDVHQESRDREQRNQVIGTVGVIEFVVERLKNIPQRKMIFLLSEGLAGRTHTDSFDVLRRVADRAARASVVIHTLSSKGVTNPAMMTAQDEVLPVMISGPNAIMTPGQLREDEENRLNTGLAYLAYTTGGTFVRNSNRLEVNIERIMDRYSGYYLVAYEPSGEFSGKAFHKIQVSTTKSNLKLEYRKGFYGRETRASAPSSKSEDGPLFLAIASPFQENGMDLRLTVLNEPSGDGSSTLRTLVHVPGDQLELRGGANGPVPKGFDVVAVILDEKAKVVAEFNRTYNLQVPAVGLDTVRRNGLDFSADLKIPKPGVYSIRLAIRDKGTGMIGSVGDTFITRPAKKGDIYLSVFVTTYPANERPFIPPPRPANAAFAPVITQEAPSVRRYRPGSILMFSYEAHGTGLDRSTKRPDLTRELRLYRDGKLIEAFPERPVEFDAFEAGIVTDSGGFRIPESMEVGEYTLQLIVRDRVTRKTAAEWIDFEVSDQR